MNIRTSPKRLFPNPSSNAFYRNFNASPDLRPKKFNRGRNTDYTQDRASEPTQSRSQQVYDPSQMEEDLQNQVNHEKSAHFHNQVPENTMMRMLTAKQEKIVQLRERLKNIHHFYRVRIEEERSKNFQRNEIFIGVIEELQKNHSEKIVHLHQSLEEMDEEKKGIGYVDQRMGSIKNKVEDILAESKELKTLNESMQKEIMQKEHIIKQKQAHYMEIKQQTDDLRSQLQKFQRSKLKENKRNKELVELIDNAF